jgi:hypothetical protein
MVGFPHSEILGSKLIRSSPGLIAAYYVLHRLHAPRHPLDALKALDRSHYLYPQRPRPLLKGRLVIGQRTKDHVLQRGRLIGQIKKNQNSRAVAVSLPGCGIKQAAKHLFTMSKDPAAEPSGISIGNSGGSRLPNLLSNYATSRVLSGNWWSRTESNRRHSACKADALPTELRPHAIP